MSLLDTEKSILLNLLVVHLLDIIAFHKDILQQYPSQPTDRQDIFILEKLCDINKNIQGSNRVVRQQVRRISDLIDLEDLNSGIERSDGQ
jgi:hypothetical protein